MKKLLYIAIAVLMWGGFGCKSEAQTSKTEVVKQIRQKYAEAKKEIADNGKNGKAPLDVKIRINDGTVVSEDFTIDEVTEMTFYFNKYKANKELDYPDASSCYFIIVNWSANGHTSYREMLFDAKKSLLLFSFIHSETHAGLVMESRYYYGADGKLVEQKHKVDGKETTAEIYSGTGSEEKVLASRYLDIFESLMSQRSKAVVNVKKTTTTPKASRMDFIRKRYAEAKAKIASNDSPVQRDVQIVIRDQSWGPPETTDLKFYYDEVTDQVEPDAVSIDQYCYFISEHHHNNRMGFDNYSEFLFSPKSHDLIFSYTCAREEGEKNEWRYYYDENGKCIEVKTDAAEHDNGAADKQAAGRYLDIFKKLFVAD